LIFQDFDEDEEIMPEGFAYDSESTPINLDRL